MTIRKLAPHKFRLVSKRTGKNLGTFKSRKAAVRRERQVQFFKRKRR